MRFLLNIALLLVSFNCFAQVDSVSLKESVKRLDKALIGRDEKELVLLLDDEASYGHSNGWVQKKADVIEDLKSGKLNYDSIGNLNSSIVAINKEWAMVRINSIVKARRNADPPFEIKLHILQVWIHTSGKWQLLARQAAKL